MIVVADTSALIAAFDVAEPAHAAAARVMERESLVVSPLVLAELDHLVRRDMGFSVTVQVLNALLGRMSLGRYKLPELRHGDVVAAQEIRMKYEHLRLDLADAVGVVLAGRYNTNRIFTLDQRDFRAITPLTPRFGAFQILPTDGS